MTAKEFITLLDLKDECWSQDTDQLIRQFEIYAELKEKEAFKAGLYVAGKIPSEKSIDILFEAWKEEQK